jgi:hypothetical protein
MQTGWIYEVIVSTYLGNDPHSAPIGVWTDDLAALNMEIYSGSKTLENILERKDFAVNLVADVTFFHDSLFGSANVEYRESLNIDAPTLSNASAVVEARLQRSQDMGNRFRLAATPVHIELRGPVRLINRAEGLVLESLILSTRRSYLPRLKVQAIFEENYRIVKKVAPGSRYETIMAGLLAHLDVPVPGS